MGLFKQECLACAAKDDIIRRQDQVISELREELREYKREFKRAIDRLLEKTEIAPISEAASKKPEPIDMANLMNVFEETEIKQ